MRRKRSQAVNPVLVTVALSGPPIKTSPVPPAVLSITGPVDLAPTSLIGKKVRDRRRRAERRRNAGRYAGVAPIGPCSSVGQSTRLVSEMSPVRSRPGAQAAHRLHKRRQPSVEGGRTVYDGHSPDAPVPTPGSLPGPKPSALIKFFGTRVLVGAPLWCNMNRRCFALPNTTGVAHR